jgi:hypothetical protein
MTHNFRRFSLLIFVSVLMCGPASAHAVMTDLQVPVQSGVNVDWLTLTTPVLGGLGKFHGTYGAVPNAGDPNRPDQAFTFGWNVTQSGSQEIEGEPALMWRFEDYYNPFGTNSFMESHLQYVSGSGQVVRPYALQIDRGDYGGRRKR